MRVYFRVVANVSNTLTASLSLFPSLLCAAIIAARSQVRSVKDSADNKPNRRMTISHVIKWMQSNESKPAECGEREREITEKCCVGWELPERKRRNVHVIVVDKLQSK